MADFLIENGANVNSTCNDLKTPLHFALMLNHEEFEHLLLQNGASLNAKELDTHRMFSLIKHHGCRSINCITDWLTLTKVHYNHNNLLKYKCIFSQKIEQMMV